MSTMSMAPEGGGMDMAHMAEHRVYVPASVILPRTRVEIALLAPNVIPSDVARAVLAKLEAAASVFDDAARLVEPMLRGTLSARSLFERRVAVIQEMSRPATDANYWSLAEGDRLTVPAVSLAPFADVLLGCSYLEACGSEPDEGRLPAIEAAYRAIAEHATLALALARKVRVDDRPNALVDEVLRGFAASGSVHGQVAVTGIARTGASPGKRSCVAALRSSAPAVLGKCSVANPIVSSAPRGEPNAIAGGMRGFRANEGRAPTGREVFRADTRGGQLDIRRWAKWWSSQVR